MTLHKRIALLFMVILLAACSTPGLVGVPLAAGPSFGSAPRVLVTSSPNATPTPTPFQPVPPTPVFIPTLIPTLAATPTPTATPEPTQEPTPTALVFDNSEMPDKMVNVLLLGSDQREGEPGFRTDTILLAMINPKKGIVSLVSFPRDLYVNIPGYGLNRINTAWTFGGGFKGLASTLKANFGVDPDYYVLINFHAFQQLVDSLGGIDVHVEQSFTDKRQGFGNYTVPAGVVHMNARLAMWYVRARKSTNDFSRARRQQEVLLAIAYKIVSLDGLGRVDELFGIYRRSVTTDVKLVHVLPYLPLAAQLAIDSSRIRRYFIGPGDVWDYITPEGGMVLMPNTESIRDILRRAANGK